MDGPNEYGLYIHNGIKENDGFTDGFLAHAMRLPNCFVLPQDGYGEILGHEIYAKVEQDGSFMKSYLSCLERLYRYDKQTSKKRKLLPKNDTEHQFIPDKSISLDPQSIKFDHLSTFQMVILVPNGNTFTYNKSAAAFNKMRRDNSYPAFNVSLLFSSINLIPSIQCFLAVFFMNQLKSLISYPAFNVSLLFSSCIN
jgi:hypothetical protein